MDLPHFRQQSNGPVSTGNRFVFKLGDLSSKVNSCITPKFFYPVGNHPQPSTLKDISQYLFPNGGPTVEDIAQGELGDCQWLASLITMVSANPDLITRMFAPNQYDLPNTLYMWYVSIQFVVYSLTKFYSLGDGVYQVPTAIPTFIDRANNFSTPFLTSTFGTWPFFVQALYVSIVGGYDKLPSVTFLDALKLLTGCVPTNHDLSTMPVSPLHVYPFVYHI